MQEIFLKSMEWFEQKLPFVIYASPEETIIHAYFWKNSKKEFFFGQSGFVFSSFDGNQKVLFDLLQAEYYSGNLLDFIKVSKRDSSLLSIIKEQEKSFFENLVIKAQERIHADEFKKVVLSRKVTIDYSLNFVETFKNLLQTYPSAFRYCFFDPEIGMWMGATPERLVKITQDVIETVSLAGTQLFGESIFWEEKEKQEQQFVTDYIKETLDTFLEKIEISNPYTIRAGHLAHIKTNIYGTLKASFNETYKLLFQLHPTPAVCGLPKTPAINFIKKEENYDRKFYTGFLGKWDEINGSDIFVNLRCMEIKDGKINLYVGCGITEESNPEKEFLETENKLKTMLKIIV